MSTFQQVSCWVAVANGYNNGINKSNMRRSFTRPHASVSTSDSLQLICCCRLARILGCWTTSASTRVSGSSAGKPSGSSPSSPPTATSACSPTTSAHRSQCPSVPLSVHLLIHPQPLRPLALILHNTHNKTMWDTETVHKLTPVHISFISMSECRI